MPDWSPPPVAQRKGALLRRGKPAAVAQRLPGGEPNSLKGYSLSTDGALPGIQPAAGNGWSQRSQRTQQPAALKRRPAGAREAQHSLPWMSHAAGKWAANAATQPVGSARTNASAASSQDAASPSDGDQRHADGSTGAAARFTGKKRKPVGAAQQADIVSGILAQKTAATNMRTAEAKSGTLHGQTLIFTLGVFAASMLVEAELTTS